MKITSVATRQLTHQAKRQQAAVLTRSPGNGRSNQLADFNTKESRERREAVSQYYRGHDITESAQKQSVRFKAGSLLYLGRVHVEESDFLRTSQYIQTELPVRLAHRVKGFRQLPFIVTTNPKILEVMELYMKSYKIISSFNNGKRILRMDEALEFTNVLEQRLAVHGNVIDKLSDGFRESHAFIIDYCNDDEDAANDLVETFLNRSLTSRLGIRLLVKHHLKLREQIHQQRATSDQVGIIQRRWRPEDAIMQISDQLRSEFPGKAIPRVQINGHTDSAFPYIPEFGFDRIMEELLKNSFRAVMDTHISSARQMPPVEITIAVNQSNFTIRIADRGRGIGPDQMAKIWRYHYTGHKRKNEYRTKNQGIGLPIARAYAQYLGGQVEIKSMHGIGCDTYLKLAHIDPRDGSYSFRI